MARFGLLAPWPASTVARLLFRDREARALFAGMAAHSLLPLETTRLGCIRMGARSVGARGRLADPARWIADDCERAGGVLRIAWEDAWRLTAASGR